MAILARLALHQRIAGRRVSALLHLARDAGLVRLALFVVDAAVVASWTDLEVDVCLCVV